MRHGSHISTETNYLGHCLPAPPRAYKFLPCQNSRLSSCTPLSRCSKHPHPKKCAALHMHMHAGTASEDGFVTLPYRDIPSLTSSPPCPACRRCLKAATPKSSRGGALVRVFLAPYLSKAPENEAGAAHMSGKMLVQDATVGWERAVLTPARKECAARTWSTSDKTSRARGLISVMTHPVRKETAYHPRESI